MHYIRLYDLRHGSIRYKCIIYAVIRCKCVTETRGASPPGIANGPIRNRLSTISTCVTSLLVVIYALHVL